MKEKIIAIIFCLTIAAISGSTVVRRIVDSSVQEVTEEDENTIAETHEYEQKLQQQSQQQTQGEAGDASDEPEPEEEKDDSFLGAIGSAVDDFVGDLSGKEEGAKLNSKISQKISGDTYIESKTVLLGKDGWLFYKAADDGDSMSDYKGTNHYSTDKMKEIQKKLEDDARVIKSKGSKLVLFMVPNKESVYSEYMPDNVKRKSQKTRMDLFADYLQKNSKLNVVYPKEEIMAAKAMYQTYYKTDTHWNQIGAFISIMALKEKVDHNYDSLESVQFKAQKNDYAGDLAKLCKMTDTFNDDIKYALDKKSVNKDIKSKKRVLLVGDSFSELMTDELDMYFKDVKRIDIWSYHLSEVEDYKPDIVVWECVERYLDRYDWLRMSKQ